MSNQHGPTRIAAVAAVLISLLSAPSLAETAQQKARREAAAFLQPCPGADSLCRGQQKQFTESYILSKSGSSYFMGDIIGFLDPDFGAAGNAKKDLIEACAWRYVRTRVADEEFIPVYQQDWTRSCANTPQANKAALISRVNDILAEMRAGQMWLNPDQIARKKQYEPLEAITVKLMARTFAGFR